jgi:hypothetical protein
MPAVILIHAGAPQFSILGCVTVDGMVGEDRDWAWQLSRPYAFRQPVTGVKGRLSLWHLPDSLRPAVEAQLHGRGPGRPAA